jgi:uncharacterized protein YjeT (DUF2065 family)
MRRNAGTKQNCPLIERRCIAMSVSQSVETLQCNVFIPISGDVAMQCLYPNQWRRCNAMSVSQSVETLQCNVFIPISGDVAMQCLYPNQWRRCNAMSLSQSVETLQCNVCIPKKILSSLLANSIGVRINKSIPAG